MREAESAAVLAGGLAALLTAELTREVTSGLPAGCSVLDAALLVGLSDAAGGESLGAAAFEVQAASSAIPAIDAPRIACERTVIPRLTDRNSTAPSPCVPSAVQLRIPGNFSNTGPHRADAHPRTTSMNSG